MLLGSFAHAAVSSADTVLDNSVKQVPAWTHTGTINPLYPIIIRNALQADEEAATMEFEVSLKLRNVDQLKARIARGEIISASERAAKYEPLVADFRAVTKWLSSQGFTVDDSDPDHMLIFAKGSVNQIAHALKLTFGRVTLENKEYTSALTAPSVPTDLGSLMIGINGLQPHIHPHHHVMHVNSLNNTNPPYLPSQVAKADLASGLYNSGITGAGQTIAIAIDTFPLQTDLTTFWQDYSVPQTLNHIAFIQVVAGTLPATSEEETLDTEWSSSIAPGANVRVYAAQSLNFTALDKVYKKILSDAPTFAIHQMSMSFGLGETSLISQAGNSSQITTDDNIFMMLESAGVTPFASSGDGGSTPDIDANGNNTNTGPLQVETPASSTYVTGVGGTSLRLNPDGTESSESAWSLSGGGASSVLAKPSWQTGTGVPTSTKRLVPDVAMPADTATPAVLVYKGAQTTVAGTSWSSPTMAGFCALINQVRGTSNPIGLLGPHIYPLIGTSNFRDIVTGSNSGGTNANGNYSANTGYDEVTGIGVPLVTTLIGQPQPSAQTITPGQNATFTITPTSASVTFQWQRMAFGTTTWTNLSDNGTYTGTATASLTIHSATAVMSGDEFECTVSPNPNTVNTSFPARLLVTSPLTVTLVAGQVGTTGSGDGTGTGAQFNFPSGVAVDSSGNVFVADFSNNSIRKVNPLTGAVTTFFNTSLNQPNGVAFDSAGNLYVADSGNNLIREITPGGTLSTLGGSATFDTPSAVAVDSSGNVYVADTADETIRKIATNGTVTILAGETGTFGYRDGAGSQALFNSPFGVAVDSSGNVYVADFGNFAVRKITSTGVVSTLAGQGGVGGYTDGTSTTALFNAPIGVALDNAGNLYVTDAGIPPPNVTPSGNDLIRVISPTGLVSTLAGQAGVTGSSNGTGPAAEFFSVQAVAVNPGTGELFLADTFNHTIRAAGVAPGIATQPLAQVITVGQPATFSVTPSGAGPFTYHWKLNGNNIGGATSATFTIASVSSGSAGDYSVAVSNPFGSVTSNSVALIPVSAPPISQTVTAGQSATFSITVVGPAPLTYQWEFNGGPISGATSSSFTINPVTSANAGSYSVIVSDANGIATTSSVTLTVNAAVASANTDTPTMPPWTLLLMGVLFVALGSRYFPTNRRES